MKRILLLSLIFSCCLAISAQKTADYENSYNYKHALELLQSQDEPDENGALESLGSELQEHPKNGYAYYYIGLIKMNNERYGDALAAFTKAIEYLKKNKNWISFAYRQRASVYLNLEKDVLALNDWTASLKANPNDENTLFDRAEYYYKKKDFRKADADYDLIIKNNPSSDIAYLGKGRNASEEEEYQKAIDLLNYAVKLNPESSKNFAFRAQAYMGLKKYAEAADDMISAMSIDLNNSAFYAIQNWKIPEMNTLIAKLKIQAAKNKAEGLWPYCIGMAYEANDIFVKAIDAYEKSLKIEPNDVLYYRLANCYDELGDSDLALDAIDKAIEIDSTDVDYLISKSNILYDMGRTKEAIATCTSYIDKNPDYFGGYYRRGFFKDNTHDVDGAIEDYSTSIMLDSTFTYAYLGRGDMYELKGNKEAAMADYRKVVEQDTIYGENNTAQYALLALGEKDKAIAFLDSILVHSENKGNLYDASCLYARMGNKKQALDYLEKSFEKGYRNFVHIGNDDDMDVLREMPEFKALIEKYRKMAESEKRKQKEELGIKDDLKEYTCEIPFTKENGTCYVKCKINGLPLKFTFDTGAADVSLSMVEANFMMKNGYLNKGDIIGKGYYSDATGTISEGTIVNIRKVEFGDLSLDNVRASIVKNQKAPLLLGQTVLSRAGKIEIDNEKNVLNVKYKK